MTVRIALVFTDLDHWVALPVPGLVLGTGLWRLVGSVSAALAAATTRDSDRRRTRVENAVSVRGAGNTPALGRDHKPGASALLGVFFWVMISGNLRLMYSAARTATACNVLVGFTAAPVVNELASVMNRLGTSQV